MNYVISAKEAFDIFVWEFSLFWWKWTASHVWRGDIHKATGGDSAQQRSLHGD